jgi:hypothetical protein
MKKLLIWSGIITMLLLTRAVPADVIAADTTVVNVGAATSCPTYCTGFTTDSADFGVDWINPNYNGTLHQY